ncbi:MAG TPA: S26 family signal peptidase, partial [Candidatus Defluviicoccus seviourii]|nr:S26 family signal peptidase [Candidatus Defluviicoccus seviourii]
MPIGLYELERPSDLRVGDLVAVMPDKLLADFMVERGYIGRGVPLMKHVAALSGQRVCRSGNAVTVDAVPLGDALDRDTRGRPLPIWRGCRRLA